jgi:hypothetical protein
MPDVKGAHPAQATEAAALMSRYTGRRGELSKLRGALGEQRYPEERAILAGSVLAAAGDVLRRSRALGAGALGDVDAALAALPREDVGGWLGVARADGTRKSMSRALDEAFEIGLSETTEEREGHTAAALEGLSARDRLESTLSALGRWEHLSGKLEGRAGERLGALRAELSKLDGQLRRGARALIALNDTRRGERDLLDEPGAHGAWWFAARAECDELLGVFSGRGAKAQHCAECARDSAEAAQVEAPPRKHASADDLWRHDMGLLGEHERAWLQRHAAQCGECKQALRAVAEGERAIDEEGDVRVARPAAIEARPRDESVLDHPLFRAVLSRAGKRARVLVEAKGKAALRSATLVMASAPDALKARKTVLGLEFNLGPSRRVADRTARLVVELEGERQRVELDWEL